MDRRDLLKRLDILTKSLNEGGLTYHENYVYGLLATLIDAVYDLDVKVEALEDERTNYE